MSITAIAAITIGAHIASAHFPNREHYQNDNPGLYVKGESWTAGAYRNSIGRTSVYGAYTHPIGPLEGFIGLASGYQRVCSTQYTVTGSKTKMSKQTAPAPEPVVTQRETCTGFSRGYLTPIGGVSYAPQVRVLGLTPRVSFMPGFKHSSSVLHFSMEAAF